MKKQLESISKKMGILAMAGLASLTIGCASLKQYVEPKLGAIVPVSAQKQDYKPSFLAGVDYGFNIKETGLGFEAGLDYFHSSAEYIETNSFIPRIGVNFSPFDLFLQEAKVKPYVSAGASLLTESSTIDISQFNVHKTVKDSAFGIDLGIGATLFDRVNVKVGYTLMPSSENVKGTINLTAGYRILFDDLKSKK
jgi:outer membrane autotransporter protein